MLVHTAALVGMPSDDSAFWTVNVLGPRRALDAAVEGGVERFVHLYSIVTSAWSSQTAWTSAGR